MDSKLSYVWTIIWFYANGRYPGISRDMKCWDIPGYSIVIGVKTPRSLKYFDEIEATELSVSRLVANSRFQDG